MFTNIINIHENRKNKNLKKQSRIFKTVHKFLKLQEFEKKTLFF